MPVRFARVAVLALGALALAVAAQPAAARSLFALQAVAHGVPQPTCVAAAPAAAPPYRLFACEKPGRVVEIGSGGATTVLDITAKVASVGEEGLLAIAFSPSFAADGRVYVTYTAKGSGSLVLARYFLQGEALVGEQRLLVIPHPHETDHNGGDLAFGPDGDLYLSTGDGGGQGDPGDDAQRTDTLAGKILRLDVDHGTPYGIPPTNPFADGVGGRPEILMIGLRNPWRFSFDAATGDLWIGDVGATDYEEIDRVPRAWLGGRLLNFGWSRYEGFQLDRPTLPLGAGRLVWPVESYRHSSHAVAIAGGLVYRGSAIPGLAGYYLYADFASPRLHLLRYGPRRHAFDLRDNTAVTSIVSFGTDPAGEVYLCDINGASIWKLVAAGA